MALHMNFGLSPFLASHTPTITNGLLVKDRHLSPFFITRGPSLHHQGQPDIVETKEGYLLTAHVPGVAAKDVSVNIEHADIATDSEGALHLRAGDRLKADYRLPSHLVDTSAARASCIDGVLRVVVPKKEPKDISVHVDCATDEATPMDAEDAAAEIFVLEVPGFSAKDINVTLKAPTDKIVVTGKSAYGRTFTRRFGLPSGFDPATAADNLTASCVNGIFTLRVTKPAHASSAPTSVDVLGDMPALPNAGPNKDDSAGNGSDALRLVEQAVPGIAADDLKVEVGADRMVRVTADKADKQANSRNHRHFSFITNVPAGVDIATVKAYCANGLVRITADKPAAPTLQTVEVSATALACLDPNHSGSGEEEEQ